MAVLQMQRMSICALKKDRKAILEKIQSMGVMEINHVLDEDEDFRRMDTANARSSFEKAANSADRALEILNEYAPVKTSMLSSLEGKKLVDAKVHEEVIRKREELLKVVSQIQVLDKEKAENKAEILKLENRIESLVPWLSLDIPMNATGTKKTSVILGSIPGLADISGIYEILADAAPEVEAADAYVISSGQDMTCIAVICLKQEEQSIEEALRSRGFSRIAQSSAKTPAGKTEELKQAIKEKENRISQIEQEVIKLAEQREEIYLLADYYRVRAEKYEVLGEIPQSANTFVLSGYVPHWDVEKVKRVLALGLATGVIAQVVNQMGSMGGKSVFGVILFVIVFIIGHVFNIAINLLGAYVHTNRLQYVEFFGKFYEGGGRAFHPFRENTKYADVKEE